MKFYTGSVTGFAAGDKHRIIILAKNLHALISLSAWYDHKWINVYESKTNDITCKSHDMNSNFEEIFQVNRIIIINHSLFIRRYLAKYWNYCPSKVLLCSNMLNYNHNWSTYVKANWSGRQNNVTAFVENMAFQYNYIFRILINNSAEFWSYNNDNKDQWF